MPIRELPVHSPCWASSPDPLPQAQRSCGLSFPFDAGFADQGAMNFGYFSNPGDLCLLEAATRVRGDPLQMMSNRWVSDGRLG